MPMMTAVKVSRDTVAKLKELSGGVPMGLYLERLLSTLEQPPAPATKQFSGMEVSLADVKTLITSRFDQLEAEQATRLDNMENALRHTQNWLNGQVCLITTFINDNVQPGFKKFAELNAEHLAEVVRFGREHGGEPIDVPLPYKLMRGGEVVKNER